MVICLIAHKDIIIDYKDLKTDYGHLIYNN